MVISSTVSSMESTRHPSAKLRRNSSWLTRLPGERNGRGGGVETHGDEPGRCRHQGVFTGPAPHVEHTASELPGLEQLEERRLGSVTLRYDSKLLHIGVGL